MGESKIQEYISGHPGKHGDGNFFDLKLLFIFHFNWLKDQISIRVMFCHRTPGNRIPIRQPSLVPIMILPNHKIDFPDKERLEDRT